MVMINEKNNIRTALKDLELEGHSIPDEMIVVADEYADGKISGCEMVRKMVKIAKKEKKYATCKL